MSTSKNKKIKVEVLVSTIHEMTNGAGRSKWFTLSDYDNHADFFNASLDHVQKNWGEKSPSIRLTNISTDMPFLNLVTEHGTSNDLWALMAIGDLEKAKKVTRHISEVGMLDRSMSEVIELVLEEFTPFF